ncbi:MAG: alpha/beta fold hydrolase, partial [Caulobacteraceae bacterium]|nr:alpha/beta fold hydrolase [Caulobacter sp.]
MRGLDWERDGRDWPNRPTSRRVVAGGVSWHVQVMGDGPVLLLLHGTAASTHSFRDLAPRLAEHFTVVAPDLPGHGFTGFPGRSGMGLPSMADGISALLAALGGLRPVLAAGHSAGAAVLLRMALDGTIAPDGIVALNGALLPFRGPMGHVAPGLARLLALNGAVPHLVSLLAGEDGVRRMLAGMGSRIDRRGIGLYARLMRDPAHVRGALAMMAGWDLAGLERDLPRLATPLTLVV